MSCKQQVLEYITNNPGCTVTEMDAVFKFSVRTIRLAVKKLKEENLIKMTYNFSDMRKRHYYPNGVATVCAIENGVGLEA